MEDLYNERAESLPIDALQSNSDNPRNISPADFQQLIHDIERDASFLLAKRILVNRDNQTGTLTVYAGNQRLEACKVLGYKEVPCSIADDLPAEVMRKRALLDNHHAGEWNMEKLLNSYNQQELEEMGAKFLTDLEIDFADALNIVEEQGTAFKPKGEQNEGIIKSEIVFETIDERAIFDNLLAYLRKTLLQTDTAASRLVLLAKAVLGAPDLFAQILQKDGYAKEIEEREASYATE